MGGLLSLGGPADLLNFAQQIHAYRRADLWSKRGYDISLQSMRIDILNTVREEMRDQVTVIVSSLDNLMVVATLMLSIGFGFVVEGTFPPPEDVHEYEGIEQFLLVLYAVLCALSLVFPLACLMLTIAARFEVELCQQDVMGDLQRHLLKALTRDQEEAEGIMVRSASRRSTRELAFPGQVGCCPLARRSRSCGPSLFGSLPRRSESQPSLQPRRSETRGSFQLQSAAALLAHRQACAEDEPARRQTSPSLLGRSEDVRKLEGKQGPEGIRKRLTAFFEDDHIGHVVEADVREIAEGLQQKVKYYKWLYDIAQVFLWLGMICAVVTCSVLLGLFFRANYPETVWVWRCYSGILSVCALASVVFLVWMRSCMLAQPRKKVRERTPAVTPAATPAASPMAMEPSWRRSDAASLRKSWRHADVEAPPEDVGGFQLRPPRAAAARRASSEGCRTQTPEPAERAAAVRWSHEHRLVLTSPADHFSAWRCDGCKTRFGALAGMGRYRCSETDFDLCANCYHLAEPSDEQPLAGVGAVATGGAARSHVPPPVEPQEEALGQAARAEVRPPPRLATARTSSSALQVRVPTLQVVAARASASSAADTGGSPAAAVALESTAAGANPAARGAARGCPPSFRDRLVQLLEEYDGLVARGAIADAAS